MKDGEILDYLSDYQLVRKDYVLCSNEILGSSCFVNQAGRSTIVFPQKKFDVSPLPSLMEILTLYVVYGLIIGNRRQGLY
jgi:hypothetical protein